MDTFRHFWFFEPRMALWGLGLGAGLGAIYGLILGAAVPTLGLLFGPFFGGVYGAIAGLAALGVFLAQRTLVRGDGRGARLAVRVPIWPVERRLVKRMKA
jgi:hypothetical protein